MEVYISYGLDIKNKTAENAIKFIDEQLVIISDSLTHAEGSLEKFRLDNSFLNLSNEGAIIQRKLEDFENIKTSFELQLHYYEYLSEYLDSKNKNATIISPTVMGISDQVLLNLVEEYSTMQKEKEKLSLNLEINQPAVELLERGMNQIQLAMRENIKNGNTTLTGSIDEENKKIAVIESEIRKLPTTERKLINIQRKFDLNNTVYTYMLEKRAESSIAMASHVSDNRRIDEANFLHASMIKPRTRINYMFAVFFGLFLPMVWILLMDYFNDKVLDAKDIEKMTSIPIIGYVGHNEGHSELYVTEKPGSSFAESFRSIRTSIKYFIKENNKPVISISSTVSSEGKTFTAINLSAIIAMNGKKVLLIGLDMRKPSLSRAFNIDTTNGMSSYLSGNCEYEVVIKETLVKNLFYAPSGPVPPNPAELIERPEMKLFIEKAKAEFDFILIDTPPVAIVTDALLLAELVDLNLFIVRQRYTTRKSLEFMEKLNKNNELKKMAIVVNDISLDGYYGYGLRYGYTMGYGYTYGTGYYGKGYLSRYGYDDKGRGYYHDED
jgi:capsular exopolysaccharide synthesis family protein